LKYSLSEIFFNEELLRTAKQERNILHTKTRNKTTLIDHTFRTNCLLNHVI